jgi:protein-L-isoaspartate(D-aspartate) O-methyltransferase
MEPVPKRYLEARTEHLCRTLERSVSDPKVLEAFASVPRHFFVPATLEKHAYEDRPLPLADGQTISQPTMVAIMLEALGPEPSDRALEIGAGSGYAAAVLSRLVRVVHAVEIRPELAMMARDSLARAGIDNVIVHDGDGSLGLSEHAPFDRILVSAGARHVPERLVTELARPGAIVIPVDQDGGQVLHVGERRAGTDEIIWRKTTSCAFVPLIQS